MYKLTKQSFIVIISFTKLVKGVLKVKYRYANEREIVYQKMLSIPIVNICEIKQETKFGFDVSIELDDGYSFEINAYVLRDGYPAQIQKIIDIQKNGKIKNGYKLVVAPFISEASYLLCEKENIGYIDLAGNCLIKYYSIYMSVSGNKNSAVSKRALKSIFEKSSTVSSAILRTMLADVKRTWKLKELSEKVGCSIGQISKVKDFLQKNAWIEREPDGIRIVNAEAIMKEWSAVYSNKTDIVYECYSLDTLADFEAKLEKMKNECGIEYYLTGFAGGVRYAPVVRYKKTHVYIAQEDIKEAMKYLECKQVDSGSNIALIVPYDECVLSGSRKVNDSYIASPVQVYLDCMQLKGRGEELAEAILTKGIL